MNVQNFKKLLRAIADGTATQKDRAIAAKTIQQRLSQFNRLVGELETALKEDAHIKKIKKSIKQSS